MAFNPYVPHWTEQEVQLSRHASETACSSLSTQAGDESHTNVARDDDCRSRGNGSEKAPKRKSALRWVTTTHPDQVKDKETMKSIRAHALKNSEYHQKRTRKSKGTVATRTLLKISKKPKLASSIQNANTDDLDLHSATFECTSHLSPGNSTCSSSDSSELGAVLNTLAAESPPLYIHSPGTLIRRLSIEDLLNADKVETVSETNVEAKRQLVDHWSSKTPSVNLDIMKNPGSAIDPFRTLPQFTDPRVKVEQLQYFCTMLRNDTWGVQHSRLVINSRLLYLSSVCAGAAYMEAFQGIAGESLTSAAVKAEVINMINERLRDPVLQADDETIAAVCHMINFEVFHSEPRLVTHIRGLEQLILQRGGLDQFAKHGDGAQARSAEMLTRGLRVQSRVMGGLLVNELQPDPRWQSFIPPPPKANVSALVRLPESPAHGIKIKSSLLWNFCAKETFKLLCDMQQLTNILFDLDSNADKSMTYQDLGASERPDLKNDCVAMAIYDSLIHLPSAALSGTHLSGDWVYECCRLISLIYATAVIHRIPFSAATPLAANLFQTPNILQKLNAALRNTDLENCWGNMSGCLFWVSTIACPATHLPDGAIRSPEDDLAKKWFIMVAIRANALPAQKYGHGDANDAAMRLLLKVQAAISG